ncbi:MAG: tyrosine-type recombinase/integrase [Kofleriaceae bacterium]|nr:tyrosine-type recombinase/integrase [Kofleriaceae bacterium]MBP9168007.1 tyrosine-type recombinase/integrase [Kofleriaceae bacterium]MBP9856841.1 tyrosine-type recombinase/integrase [Kofleriaceae bacterium]
MPVTVEEGRWLARPVVTFADGTTKRIAVRPRKWGFPNTAKGAEQAERIAIAVALHSTSSTFRPNPMAARPGVLSLPATGPAPAASTKEVTPIPTFGEFAPTLIDHATANQRAAATVAAVRKFIARALPYFGAKRLDQIGAPEVTTWTRQLQGAGLSPGSLAFYRWRLKSALAIAREYFPTLGPAPRIEVAKAPRREVVILTADQIARLIDVADPRIATMIDLADSTGMRIGELRQLRRAAVRSTPPVIEVREAVVGNVVGPPKGRRARVVPMTPRLASALQAHIARSPASEWVFPDHDGRRMREARVRQLLDAALAAAGIARPKGLAWHWYRHSCATRLQTECGIAPGIVGGLLGHRDLSTLAGYTHVTQSHQLAAMESAEALRASVTPATTAPATPAATATTTAPPLAA